MTLGSEATLVRDILVEDCRVTGHVLNVAVLKLRPDTPQHYENVHLRNLHLQSERGAIVSVQPWTQYVDLKGAPPPKSIVRNIRLEGITGRYGGFGRIRPNPGQTEISDIVFRDIALTLREPKPDIVGASGVRLENVVVNGKTTLL